MSDEKIDRIQEFPKDGRLWWVRWVDRYRVPKGGTATPGVEVFLSPMDIPLAGLSRNDILEIVAPKTVQGPSPQAPIPVFTGFIPRLAIGTVFLDGIEVGSLPLDEMEFDLKNFTISVRSVNDELDPKPKWWKKELSYRVINRREFNVADFPDAKKSQAVVIQSDEVTIVLPCHEVFRSMYAPHSEIALALTSGPWEHTKAMVINPARTLPRADGNWQITLRRRVPGPCGNLLANLSLSPSGKAGANSIYTGLLRNDGPGYMTAMIPFDLKHLRLKVKGLFFNDKPDKFLALQLMGMNLPDSPALATFRDNSNEKGEIQTRVPKEKPYATSAATLISDADGIIDVSSEEDPLASSTVTTFVLPSVTWENQPTKIAGEKPESFIYEGRPQDDDPSEVSGVSPGTPWSGDTDSGSAAYSAEGQQTRDQSERIKEVIMMFKHLRSSGRIRHWIPVSPPRRQLQAGGVPLWPLPLYAKDTNTFLAFGYLDRTTGIKRRRGALICELKFRGRRIYWLDIELHANESGRKALIYSVAEDHFHSATYKLLEIAAQNRGQWLPADELARFAGISAAETWTHTFIDKPKNGKGGRLNDHRAIDKISLVAMALTQQAHQTERRGTSRE